MKAGEYFDCYRCKWAYRLVDRLGRGKGFFCTKRNGKLKKRFRGDCKYIEGEGKE